jgi:signal transduction histidine kinase
VTGYALRLALVALAYYTTAQLGLRLALVHGQVTPVWPPTGIAVVAFLVLGYRMWPAIALGAIATNLPIGPSPLGAAIIAGGNTLAPLAAAALMKLVGLKLELERLRHAGAIVLGALAGMAISATVGTLVLVFLGPVAPADFAATWAVWWTGDAMGVLLVAPFLLSFLPSPARPALGWRQQLELGALLAAVALVAFAVFQTRLRLEYIVYPLIIVAALRFRLRGAAPAALIASGVAVWAAVNSSGAFADETLLQKMVTLQVFNVFVALASFVLVAYVETRERGQQARVSSEAKSEFLRVASHELRGPLSVLGGYLSLLASGDLGTGPDRWRGPLEILSAKTAELNAIMDQLLEVSKFDGKQSPVARMSFDLRDAVDAAVARAEPRVRLAGAGLEFERGAESVPVRGDAGQIGHVLDNLINNALSYTREPARVSIRCGAEASLAVVRISDRGVGIPDDLRPSLFEPFRRGRQPGVEDVAGTGLGLYISRELALAHGGTLSLEATGAGEGSTFALALPLDAAAATGPAHSA